MPFNSIFPLTAIDQALWLRATALLRAEEERRKSQELMQILLNSTMASTTTPAASNLNFRPPLNKHDAGGLPSKENARPHLQPPPLPKRRKIQQPQPQQQQQQQSQQQPQPPQKGSLSMAK